jgi:quercetin dioxygenase-like cupin family protein
MLENQVIRIGQVSVKFLLEGRDTNEQLAMFEFSVPVGARVPLPHSHELYDETVYGLEGVFTFTVEGEPHKIGPGEKLFIKRGQVHGFSNNGTEDAKGLAIVTPALIGPSFFKECAEVVNAGGPPDMEKMKAIFARYGLVPQLPKAVA